jgi:hypothetical protein
MAKALEFDEKALEIRRRYYRDDHPEVAFNLLVVAHDLRRLRHSSQAKLFESQALEMNVRLAGDDLKGKGRELIMSYRGLMSQREFRLGATILIHAWQVQSNDTSPAE